VAHDLNNLMGVVLGYGDLALEQLDCDSPPGRNVESMQKAARQAVSIVRQLLAFSRKQIQQPRIVSLNTIVGNMEELLRRLIGEDVQLSIDAGANLGAVKADPNQIEQVIMNLALNARDAMPEGGRLSIGTSNVELDVMDPLLQPGSPIGPHVLLTVSDTGCGMDAKTQARIFEPFFTTKAPGKGTGLGLSMAYGIVKQSGGSISVASQPGHGAIFTICLPRVEGAPQPQSTEKPSGKMLNGSETVLLVEDAEPLREVVREFLRQAGYSVLVAEGGTAALAASGNHPGPIHLLLTDVVMPGLSGPQLAQQLRVARPGVRVLFMSGYTDEALAPHGVLEEGVDLIEKPFTRGSLLTKMRDVLDAAGSSLCGALQCQ
jgi:CheY-like chemotaxis protein